MPRKDGTRAPRTENERTNNRASAAAFYLANKETVLEQRRERHRQKCEAEGRAYVQGRGKNYPKLTEAELALRPIVRAEQNRKRYWANPERFRKRALMDCMNRRARKMGDCSRVTVADIEILWGRQNGICPWCNEPLDQDKINVDHWIPLARGGSNTPENLRLLHPLCNRKKWAKLPNEVLPSLTMEATRAT